MASGPITSWQINGETMQTVRYIIWGAAKSKMSFPGGFEGKASACNAGDPGSIPESGRSPREGNGNPLQYSCLENAMDGGAWEAAVHGVTKSWTQLSIFTTSLKITVDGNCSHEIKRCLLLGGKVMTNLDSILKSRDITLPKKVHLVKTMLFPVVMYRCESWTIKKAEHQRIDAFELWCWKTLLRVSSTARRSNQSILKEISPECSLEGLMLKLKFQDFGHLMRRVDSLEKTLMLGGIGGRRRRGWQRMRWLDCITNSMDIWVNYRSWWWTGRPGVLQFMGSQRVRHNWGTELNWTELKGQNKTVPQKHQQSMFL